MAWSGTNNRGYSGSGKGEKLADPEAASPLIPSPNGMTEDMMDQENQRMTENLAGKVNRLKNITFDLETDAKDSDHYLSGMQEDFDGSKGLLTGTMNRLNHMVGGGKNNRKLMCYLILGLVSLFVIIYYFIMHFRAG